MRRPSGRGAGPFLGVALGLTRVVLLVGPWALKLPNAANGWRQFAAGLFGNRREAALWAAAGRPDLCPVVASLPGGLLVVMRRARPLSPAEWDALDRDLADGRDLPPGAERKPDSFGVLGSRVVAVDYGTRPGQVPPPP